MSFFHDVLDHFFLYEIQSEPDRVYIFNFNKGAPTLRFTSYSSPGMGVSLHLHLRKLGVSREKGLAHVPRRVAAGEHVFQLPPFYYTKAISLCVPGATSLQK